MTKEIKTAGEIVSDKLEYLRKQGENAQFQSRKDDLYQQQQAILADPRYVAYATQFARDLPAKEAQEFVQTAKELNKTAIEELKDNPPSRGRLVEVDKVYDLAEHHGKKERGTLLVDEIKKLSGTSKEGFGADLKKNALIHMQADPRYLQYIDEYLEGSDFDEQRKDRLRERALKAHESAADHVKCNPENAAATRGSNQIFAEIERKGAAPLVSAQETHLASKTPTAAANAPAASVTLTSTPAGGADAISTEDRSTTTAHAVKHGDSLWKIAQEHYGLTDPKDIQKAVENIARENGMEGLKANHLKIGQDIQLPNSPNAPEGTPGLDWKALDAERSASLRGTFHTQTPAFVKPDTTAANDTNLGLATNDDAPDVSSSTPSNTGLPVWKMAP